MPFGRARRVPARPGAEPIRGPATTAGQSDSERAAGDLGAGAIDRPSCRVQRRAGIGFFCPKASIGRPCNLGPPGIPVSARRASGQRPFRVEGLARDHDATGPARLATAAEAGAASAPIHPGRCGRGGRQLIMTPEGAAAPTDRSTAGSEPRKSLLPPPSSASAAAASPAPAAKAIARAAASPRSTRPAPCPSFPVVVHSVGVVRRPTFS